MKGHLKLEEQPFQWINRDDLPTREDVLRFTRLQFLTYVLSYAHNPELAEDIARRTELQQFDNTKLLGGR